MKHNHLQFQFSNLIIFLSSFLIPQSSFSQEPSIQWENTIGGTYGDELKSVIETSDGGFLLGGYSNSGISGDKSEISQGSYDYWVIKTDASGNIMWQNTIGGTGYDYLIRVIQSLDGGFLLGGYSNSNISGDKTEASNGGNDFWIIKLDASGNILWQNTVGGSGDDKLSDIVKMPSGDYILAGHSSSGISGDKSEVSQGGGDYWVIKINSTGSIVWQNTIGGSSDDVLHSINKTSDGGFLLCGESSSVISGDKTEGAIGGSDYWVVKINNLGTIIWQNVIGGKSEEYLVSAVKNPDGSFVLAGYSNSENTGDKTGVNSIVTCGDPEWSPEYCVTYDYWIVKIDIDGNLVWERSFGDIGYEYVYSMVSSGDGGYLIGGFVSYHSYYDGPRFYYRATKINENGYVVWSKDLYGAYTEDEEDDDLYLNASNVLNAVVTTADGGYMLAGYSDGNAGAMKTENCIGNVDYWIVKLAPETCIPSPIYSDNDSDGFGQDYLASTCEFTIGKWTDNQNDCNDNHSSISLISDEIYDGMDNNCDGISDVGCTLVPVIEWDNTISGDEDDELFGIAIAADGGFVLGGLSYSGISGDKTEASLSYESDYWVVKTDPSGEIIWQNSIGSIDYDLFTSITSTTDGGFILGGYSEYGVSGEKTDAGVGMNDYWLLKIDATGNIIWQNAIGGSSQDYLRFVKGTSDGGFIVGGESSSGISGDKTEASLGYSDYWIIKFDNSGNIQWQNTIGGSGYDNPVSADETLDGGFIIGGYSKSGISGDKTEPNLDLGLPHTSDYWVIKLNSSGNIVWQNTIGGSESDNLTSISKVSDGGYIISGYSNSNISGDKTENNMGYSMFYDYWIIKLDGLGNITWQNTIGGDNSDYSTNAIELSDGGFLIGGFSDATISGDKSESAIPDYLSTNYYTFSSLDYWIVRTNDVGEIIWQSTIGGNFDDQLSGLLTTPDGGFLLAGSSRSLVSSDKTENGAGKVRRISFGYEITEYNSLEKDNDYWIVKLAPECFPITEECNALDDNCNGLIDDDVIETINISAAGPTTFCQGNTVLLSAIFSGASVQWKKNGTNIAGATSSNYSVNKTGDYTAVTTSPCGTATSTIIHVTVNKNPTASITAGGATTFCAGGSVTLTEAAVAGSTYQWYKGASAIAGATSTNYIATTAGNYKCRVTKTASGCFKNSNTITVTVPCKEGEELISNEEAFSIYPNPNNGTFTINALRPLCALCETNNTWMEVYNPLGQLIYSQNLNSSTGNINETISIPEDAAHNNLSSGI
ncbi:MAG: hypothetical protein ACHQFW_10735, partial [Chitinophagales bacterium]